MDFGYSSTATLFGNMSDKSFKDAGNNSSVSPTPSYCGVSTAINDQKVFWIEGVLLSVTGLLGLLANVLTFYLLSKTKYNIYNNLILQLVFGDSIFIVIAWVDISLRKSFHLLSEKDRFYGTIWPNLIYPLLKISATWITCCTVAITVER